MSEQGMEQTQDAGRPSGVEGFTSADVSDVARMSYEQARAELVETVGRLEAGGAGLEESLAATRMSSRSSVATWSASRTTCPACWTTA